MGDSLLLGFVGAQSPAAAAQLPVGRPRMQDAKPTLGLAGGLGIALLAHLLTLTLRHAPRLLTVCLLLSLGYVAYLTLRTADRVRNPEKLAPVDRLLCRWCWVFILGYSGNLVAGLGRKGKELLE